jgi:hypothetical protein
LAIAHAQAQLDITRPSMSAWFGEARQCTRERSADVRNGAAVQL